MTARRTIAAVAVALLAAGCTDSTPVNVDRADLRAPEGIAAKRAPSTLLSNIPVAGTLADGGTFEGVLSITNLAFEDGQLLGTGTLTGTATQEGIVTEITQTFTDIPLALTGSGGGGRSCDILNLDLGPLNLDLLGLVVDLSAISLDLTAVSGPGNLLGNLLCAVAGLLDGTGPLFRLLDLIDRINDLLG
jgi:hypothetical protein